MSSSSAVSRGNGGQTPPIRATQEHSGTLSPETIHAVDELAGETSNRSRVIEEAVLEFLERRKRQLREARDLEILDATAEELNREIEDVLDFQAEP